MSKVLVDRDRVVESMCLTWRHDFGLDKLESCDFCSGMTDKEREHLRGQMGKLFDQHFAPALSAVTAERDRLREEMAELWKRIDKFQSQSHGITALAEIERLRAEVEALQSQERYREQDLEVVIEQRDHYANRVLHLETSALRIADDYQPSSDAESVLALDEMRAALVGLVGAAMAAKEA